MMSSETQQAAPCVWISLDFTSRAAGSSFDPDYVTHELGVEPTSHFRAGEPIVGNKGRRRADRWRVTIGPRHTFEIDGMLAELLARMAVGEDRLRAVSAELGIQPVLICAAEPTSSSAPTIVFPPEVVRWAAKHDVAIAVDIMLWPTDGEG